MSLSTYTTVCTRKTLLCPGVWEFAFRKPPGFTFQPGQFVMFPVPLPENPADVQVRAYSIASAPDDEELLFVIKLISGGRASRWFDQVVGVGTETQIQGPLGAFTVDRKTDKPYLFVATGTGVAPFRSQIRWLLLEEGEKRPIDLLFGVRNREEIFWGEEWQELAHRFPDFHLHLSFLQGSGGLETPMTAQEHASTLIARGPASVYLCGGPEIVATLKKSCLETWRVPKEDVHVESYV